MMRRDTRLTQAEAASRVGYCRSHFNQLETGNLLLNLEAIGDFVNVFGLDHDDLMYAALKDRMPDGWEAVQK